MLTPQTFLQNGYITENSGQTQAIKRATSSNNRLQLTNAQNLSPEHMCLHKISYQLANQYSVPYL